MGTRRSSTGFQPVSGNWKLWAYASDLPEGELRIAPAVHCRVRIRRCTSPEGTVEAVELIQPSLRDGKSLFHNPSLERLGYFQFSLRETLDEQALLIEFRKPKNSKLQGLACSLSVGAFCPMRSLRLDVPEPGRKPVLIAELPLIAHPVQRQRH